MTRIIIRNDTTENWTINNPVLSKGEIGIDTSSNSFKIGDGITAWISLPYAVGNLPEKSVEDWTFTLEDGTEVTKTIVLGA